VWRELRDAPLLLPAGSLNPWRSISQWFARDGVRRNVVAEFEDSALLEVFGTEGVGVFPAPAAVEKEVESRHGVAVLPSPTS
jgi:LysR family transcriptional activator of nhaA